MARTAVTALLALLFAGLALGGLSGSSGATGGGASQLHRVVIERFTFQPQRLEVRPGDSVEWVNRDLAPHTASAEDGDWDSGELSKEATFRTTFSSAGDFAYFCAFHPMMRGEIVVAP
ncbi:cupredoxin family copper-binding protein [Pelagibius sp. CAU 1746]|uniref:cupredoxin domain-containing protein n=1 Tax=Pelagibius sp. CAU 1746 TaxID=3140370 RepID=UPI00325A81A9